MLHYFNSHSQFWIPQFAFFPKCAPACDEFDGSAGIKIHNKSLDTGQTWANPDLLLELNGSGGAVHTGGPFNTGSLGTVDTCFSDGVITLTYQHASNINSEGQLYIPVRYVDSNNYVYALLEVAGVAVNWVTVEVSSGVATVINSSPRTLTVANGQDVTISYYLTGDNLSVDLDESHSALHQSTFNMNATVHGFGLGHSDASFVNPIMLDWCFNEIYQYGPPGVVFESSCRRGLNRNGNNLVDNYNLVMRDYYDAYDGLTYTATEDGVYLLNGALPGASGAGTSVQFNFEINFGLGSNTRYFSTRIDDSVSRTTQGSAIVSLLAGDTINIRAGSGPPGVESKQKPASYFNVSRLADAGLLFQARRDSNQGMTAHVTPVDFDDISINVGGAYSSGVFTAPNTGLYLFVYSSEQTGNFTQVIYVNGSRRFYGTRQRGDNVAFMAAYISLSAGDDVELRSNSSASIDGGNTLIRLNHCEVQYFPDGEMMYEGVQLSDTVYTPEVTDMPYPDNASDPHSAMSSGVYTIQEDGVYGITNAIQVNTNLARGQLWVDGELTYKSGNSITRIGGVQQYSTHYVLQLRAGQTISVREESSDGTTNASSYVGVDAGTRHWITIAKMY